MAGSLLKWLDSLARRVATGGEQRLEAGLALIGAGRFFEAHEELELAWRAAGAEERDFYQGLVHVAVAWYQAGRKRPLERAVMHETAGRHRQKNVTMSTNG